MTVPPNHSTRSFRHIFEKFIDPMDVFHFIDCRKHAKQAKP